jgi:hypothetical protein
MAIAARLDDPESSSPEVAGLKSKLDAICTELAAYVAATPSIDQGHDREGGSVSYRSMKARLKFVAC